MTTEGFTIKSLGGCRIVFGTVPVSDFGMLTAGFSDKAQIAIDLADLMGATLVIGEPADLDALRKRDLPVSAKRQGDASVADARGLPKVAAWLRTGSRGSSSNAMCKRLFGVPENGGTEHPHDPSDLLRCVQFLDATEAHDRLHLMSGVSPQWDFLVWRWSEITNLLAEEMETGNSAPKTYAAMNALLRSEK